MVLDVFAVIDRRMFDRPDRLVHFGDRNIFVCAHRDITRSMLQPPARPTQVPQFLS